MGWVRHGRESTGGRGVVRLRCVTGDRIVWIDCEMTGLDTTADALVEVACLVTDGELNVLGEGVDLVIRPPQEALEQMGDFVRDTHTRSGLLP